MDEKSQLELERILKLDPINLTDDEIGFLRARRGYLTSEDKRVFAIHLEDLEPAKREEVHEEPIEQTEVPSTDIKPKKK